MATRKNQRVQASVNGSGFLGELDRVRQEATAILDERTRWQAEAREQEAISDAMAQRLRELEARLGQTETELEQARAEAEARERSQVEEEKRAARLEDELRRMYHIELARRMSRENVYMRILQTPVEIIGAEKGVFLSADHPPKLLAAINFGQIRADSPLLQKVVQRVVDQEQVIAINERPEIARHATGSLRKTVRNLAAYPIIIRGKSAGVVIIANKQSGPFTEEDTKLLLGIGSHAAVALENHRLRRELEDAYSGTMALLCDAIEAKDAYTRGHCEDVAGFAVSVAQELGLNEEEQDTLFQGSLLHDVGKIAVSDGILLKPGPLLPAERELIETHVTVGAELISRVPTLRPCVPVILHHHERYDGSGYPGRLEGENIPLLARIVSVADAYGTMLSDRPYRKALGPRAARAELKRGAGTQFDPKIVNAFLRILDAPEKMVNVWQDIFNKPARLMDS